MHLQAAKNFIITGLRAGLSLTLYYHSLPRTLDVAQVAQELAAAKGVTDAKNLGLLRTATLYHGRGLPGHLPRSRGAGLHAGPRHPLPDFTFSPAQIEQFTTLSWPPSTRRNP